MLSHALLLEQKAPLTSTLPQLPVAPSLSLCTALSCSHPSSLFELADALAVTQRGDGEHFQLVGRTAGKQGLVLPLVRGVPGPPLGSLAAESLKRVQRQGSQQAPGPRDACLQAATVSHHYEVFGISTN